MGLSVIILAKNEQNNLKKLIPKLKIANEILVINDQSTDGTVETAKRLGSKVLDYPVGKDFARARNWALGKARYSWVWFIDGDESPNAILMTAVKEVMKQKGGPDGYFMTRKDIFLRRKLKFGEAGNMKLLRLGRRTAGKWKRKVHEVWEISGAGMLPGELSHRSHEKKSEFKRKVEDYAQLEAEYRYESGIPWSLGEMGIFPLAKLGKTFFWQQGFRDGYPGLMMSLMMSYHSFLVRLKGFELEFGGRLSKRDYFLGMLHLLIGLTAILGQLARVQINDYAAGYVFEGLMVVAVLTTWIRKRQVSPNQAEKWLGVAFVAMMLVFLGSLVVNYRDLGIHLIHASAYWWRLAIYGFYGWALLIWIKMNKWSMPITRILIYIGTGWAILGWAQYLWMPDMRWLYWFGWDEHYYRMIGSLFDPGFLGLLLTLTVTLAVFEKMPYKTWIIGINSLAVLLTFARSAYLVLALAIIWLGWQFKKLKWAFGACILMIMMVGILPKPGGEGVNLRRTYSVKQRADSALTAFDYFRQRPIWGYGYNAYRFITQSDEKHTQIPSHSSGPDNSYLLVLATTGILGLTAFGFWLWALVSYLKPVPYGTVSLSLIFIHAWTNNSWFYPFVMLWLIGLVAARAQKVRGSN